MNSKFIWTVNRLLINSLGFVYSKRCKFLIPAPLQEEKIPAEQVLGMLMSLWDDLYLGGRSWYIWLNNTLLELGIPSWNLYLLQELLNGRRLYHPVKWNSLSHVHLFETPGIVARQFPLSMGSQRVGHDWVTFTFTLISRWIRWYWYLYIISSNCK